MAHIIMITGAHGTGKTTLVNDLAGQVPGHVLFDMDSIIEQASTLANRNIRTRPDSWPTYNNLWLSILKAVSDNGLTPVLFSPMHPEELKTPDWCDHVAWIGLNCTEEELRERLAARNWEADQINEAVDDLTHTREVVDNIIITSGLTVAEVSQRLADLIQTSPGQLLASE